jgi:hypothetical protein
MAMELELGMVISRLNPYENTDMYLLPGNPEGIKGVLEQLQEIQAPKDWQGDPKTFTEAMTNRFNEVMENNLSQVTLRVETREKEYLAWQFKDIPRLVKRAVRIEYRHKYKNTGLWVTDHLLVGYEGSNGG